MKREDLVPSAALILVAVDNLKPFLDNCTPKEAYELRQALAALNYAASVIADLIPEKESGK